MLSFRRLSVLPSMARTRRRRRNHRFAVPGTGLGQASFVRGVGLYSLPDSCLWRMPHHDDPCSHPIADVKEYMRLAAGLVAAEPVAGPGAFRSAAGAFVRGRGCR
jgi:hypothetical protein